MVPLPAFTELKWIYGRAVPAPLQRISLHGICWRGAPGKSTGEAMDAMEQLAAKLPAGNRFRMDRAILRGTAVRRSGARVSMRYRF